jgi:long-subunit acyl-CoA synthetase (AMP-forming)
VLNERLLQSSNYSFRFDEEGFKTGDMDSMTMMVLITGRVKDKFKTDKGKYISQHH